MSPSLRIFTILVSVVFLVFVILMLRRGRYLLKYSLLWFVLGLAGLVCAFFPELVYALSDVLGFETPSNFLLFAADFFLIAFCLSLCGVVSRQSLKIKRLVQHVSLLESRPDASQPLPPTGETPLRGAESSCEGGGDAREGSDGGAKATR